MFWADKIVQEIKNHPQHLDDMKTPSGFVHIGSIRGPILHDVVYKILKQKNKKTVQTYVFNDFDSIDGLSDDLKDRFSKYMGYPLRLAPSPDGKARSFADYFAEDFKQVLLKLGFEAEFLSSWDMYHKGMFNEVIRDALNYGEIIQEVYRKVSGSNKKEQGWYPFQPICPKCSKLGTTKVTAWDGKLVTFRCEEQLVTWATGCGYEGKMSPFNGTGKLPWKVDWPAHWKVMGVTFEGAGKDHASRGGSYDIAFELCDKVFNVEKPFYFPYEHFLVGGKKMSSSKGIGLKAHDILKILPASVARFLFVRTNPKSTLEFTPEGMTIPDLFDEFDKGANAFWVKSEEDLARMFELSMVDRQYQKSLFLPRFRDVAMSTQLFSIKPLTYFEKVKGGSLTQDEKKLLKERIQYATTWLKEFAPDEIKFIAQEHLPVEVKNLSEHQKKYLKALSDLAYKENPDELQLTLYQKAKELGLSGKEAFSAIYTALIGKPFGPKAAWFLLSLKPEFIRKRFTEASKL
jgi:lysyl-tRNA synthetase class 1